MNMMSLLAVLLASVVITATPHNSDYLPYRYYFPFVRSEMTFPNTGVLDNFNRANEGPPPSSNWSNVGASAGLEVNTNQLAADAVGAVGQWSAKSFGPTAEVYATIAVLPDSDSIVSLWMRGNDTYPGAHSTWLQLGRDDPLESMIATLYVNGVQVGQYLDAIETGRAYGMRAEGGTITVYRKPVGGAWESILSVSDPDPYSTGYMGIEMTDVTARVDDFGGGGDFFPEATLPATSSVIEATLYDKSGTRIAQIAPAWESISWRLNNEGLARFRLPYTDTKCKKSYLTMGNRVLLRFGNGLPDWGGVIDTPRARDNLGVTCTAYTGEHIFGWRETGKNDVYNSMSPGAMYKAMLDAENAGIPTGITAGSIFLGGNAISREYHLHELQRQYMELAKGIDHDWSVTPVLTAGVLTFRANWYERRGADKSSSAWLVEGSNLIQASLDEQGNIANHIDQAGEGSDWGSTRYVKSVEDADSIAEFGYREWAEVTAGILTPATIDAHANARLAEMAWPVNALSLVVQNSKPAYFAAYDVGDIVRAQAFLKRVEWAYDGLVRIIAREFMPASHQCRLEVQEWRAS